MKFGQSFPARLFCIIALALLIEPMMALSVQGISDIPEKQIAVGDISVSYKEFGSGEPLILIMGFSSAMDIWDPILLNNLSSQYRVIIFDNRGVGNTTDSGAEFSIPLFARDTVGLMDALNISRANILGWSMGGNIALELAVDFPDRVNKLVLYAADPGGKEAIPPDPEVLSQLTNSSGTDRERGERMLSLILPRAWLAEHPDPREYMPDATEQVNPSTIRAQTQALSSWEGVYDRLSTITAPTLLITGDEDRIAPMKNSEMIAAQIPRAQIILIPGGGHGVMYQDPKELAEYVREFLSTPFTRPDKNTV